MHDKDDPEVALRPATPVADQLAGTMFEAPIERQSTTDRVAVKYATWRLTPDGKRAFDWIEREALRLEAAGERRIGSKSLVERARDALHVRINNLFTANIARELVLRHRILQDHFEFRERTAA